MDVYDAQRNIAANIQNLVRVRGVVDRDSDLRRYTLKLSGNRRSRATDARNGQKPPTRRNQSLRP